MKKQIFMMLFLAFWASTAPAQQLKDAKGVDTFIAPFDMNLGAGYRVVLQNGNARAEEYEYLHSSAAGQVNLEWDPLPQRFVLDFYYLNNKDYFGEYDYAYSDIVLLSVLSRSLFHNLSHDSGGMDNPATGSPSFTDLNPSDHYGTETQMNRVFVRFKAPDFPFHLYAEARSNIKTGNIQELYLRGFTGGLDKISKTRNETFRTVEYKAGVNSHLGPVEVDYSRSVKLFDGSGDKMLTDSFITPPMEVSHNLVPDFKSLVNTIKLHTSYTGGIVVAGTFSSGNNKNDASHVSSTFRNAGGDLTIAPVTNLAFFIKFRHYDLNQGSPDTAASAILGSPVVYNVRDSISSQRNTVSGTVRYRPIERLTLKGEYAWEAVVRAVKPGGYYLPSPPNDQPAFWEVGHRTTKGTAKLSAAYRMSNKLTLRANYSHQGVNNPAYDIDPKRSDTARVSVAWMPTRKITTLLSYGGTSEKRSTLDPPLSGGAREVSYNQGLASVTALVAKTTSLTASYAYFKNKITQTITTLDSAGAASLESGVPYGDVAHAVSLSASRALTDSVRLVADASTIFSRGNFSISGNAGGIAAFSNQKIVEGIYTAAVEVQHSKTMSSAFRYQHRNYDDQIDNTQDGKVETILATLAMKW